jgi:hypothetical protein
VLALLAAAAFARAAAPESSTYDDHRLAAIRACDAINPSAYQTGLLFNPAGYRSFYLKSECLQRAAVQFRDESLCDRVRRRWSLFSSSWGYSPANCRTLVSERVARARAVLQEMRRAYEAGHVTLRDFRIELNGNGRDFELIPVISGDAGHGYDLRLDAAPAPGAAAVTLHHNGYWMTGSSQLRIYLTRDEVARALPDLSPGRSYSTTASIVFSLPPGDSGGEWSDAFAESLFPLALRTQTLTKVIAFPAPR